MVRAITWETAHKDIDEQKSKKMSSQKFKITGISYDRNRNNKEYFRNDAPPEIKALEKDFYNRTNPLWNKALDYVIRPDFVYEIKKIEFNK